MLASRKFRGAHALSVRLGAGIPRVAKQLMRSGCHQSGCYSNIRVVLADGEDEVGSAAFALCCRVVWVVYVFA